MNERKTLSELIKRARGLRTPNSVTAQDSHRQAIKHDMLLIVGPYGKVIGMVKRDDLFDEEGNRFYSDV